MNKQQIAELPDTSAWTGPKGIDHDQIIKVKEENPRLSTRQIGKLFDCSHVNVTKVLSKYALNTQETEEYKDNRADIYAGKQSQILKLKLTDDEIKKMNGAAAALWFNSLFNNERLTRGQSTQNIESHLMLRTDQTLDSKLDELKSMVDSL